MTSFARLWLLGILVGATVALSADAAQASFGVTPGKFEAGTCIVNSCTYETATRTSRKASRTATFAAVPDVPVTSITVNLPLGPHSALSAIGNLCTSSLVMPATITGRNGAQVKQNTKIAVTKCGAQIVKQKVVGNAVVLTVQTYASGRISAGGSGLATVSRSLPAAKKTTTLRVSSPVRARAGAAFSP